VVIRKESNDSIIDSKLISEIDLVAAAEQAKLAREELERILGIIDKHPGEDKGMLIQDK